MRNDEKTKRLFFTFVFIPMKGIVLGQIGDKCLKLAAFFRTILTGSRYEWIESNLTHFQPYTKRVTVSLTYMRSEADCV